MYGKLLFLTGQAPNAVLLPRRKKGSQGRRDPLTPLFAMIRAVTQERNNYHLSAFSNEFTHTSKLLEGI